MRWKCKELEGEVVELDRWRDNGLSIGGDKKRRESTKDGLSSLLPKCF